MECIRGRYFNQLMDESIYREIGKVKKPLSINYHLKELYARSDWPNREKNIS